MHTILQLFDSPFEADAQVSHLVRIGLADAAASSDSDLLTFACPMTLYDHLNTKRKDGVMVRWAHTCSSDINKMNEVELVHTSCLTGYDYIPRLRGMSLRKAVDTVLAWRGKVFKP